jgi:hypothetical protein
MALDFESHVKSYLGIYEYELLGHLKKMVRRGSRCFDVGGKDGYDALMMAKLSGANVASFECDPIAAKQMRSTFAKNPKLSIEVVEAFVGSADGVGYTTIDKASKLLFVPDFIKLDIEGAEDLALEGASETLSKHRPSLIVEVHGVDKEERCLSILKSLDYLVKVVNQGSFLKDPTRLGHNRWLAAYPTLQ